jgi:AAA domain-containing protein
VPSAPESSFNAVTWRNLDAPAKELEWLIKSVLTRGEVSVWYGLPGSGKSFLISDAALSIARGLPWFGRRVRQGLVIYQAGEGGLGLKKRLRAYRQHHGMAKNEDLPFVILPSPINLFIADADVDRMIAEIKLWAAYYDAPLELVVIDTMSSAIAGADENASGDMTKVLSRCRKISIETGAHVAIVHHTPKGGGSPRGWSGLSGNVENMIEVVRSEQTVSHTYPDGNRTQLDMREFVTVKQKDDVDKFVRAFTLPQVKLGLDIDGDPITSCIVAPHRTVAEINTGPIVPPGYVILQPNQLTIFRALMRAMDQHKIANARQLGVPCPEATYCVKISDWRGALEEMSAGTDEPKRIKSRVQKAVERAVINWTVGKKPAELLGHNGDWVWRMERKIHGIDPPPAVDEVVRHDELLTAEDAAAMLDLR